MKKYPKGVEPFQMVARLLEECGEVASEVNHFEGSGIKLEKHGEPDKTAFANEIIQSLLALMQIVKYYSLEGELEVSIEGSVKRLKEHGYLD